MQCQRCKTVLALGTCGTLVVRGERRIVARCLIASCTGQRPIRMGGANWHDSLAMHMHALLPPPTFIIITIVIRLVFHSLGGVG